MINKEIILNADGTIKKDFSDRAIPQNSNNQVSVNVLIPSTCFTGLQNYAVILAVSRIISNVETTLNTLVMSVSKSITIDGVVYVKYTAYLTTDYTDKLGQLKFSPYIQTTATITEDDETSEVISIQQSFTNSNLNVIKSVLPQYDASLEEGTIATTLETQINGKKIYTFIDDATSEGEHYYNLVDGFNPSVDQFKGCLVVSVWNGTSYIMPYSNDGVELLEITSDGVFYKISNVSYEDNTYTYTKSKVSYTKAEVDSIETSLQNQIDGKVDKTQKVNGHALSGDITILKSDAGIDLGNVANYGVETTLPTASGDQLYITSKAVYDALQDLNSTITLALSGKADTTDITSLDTRLDAIEKLIGDNDGDADNIINTLKEVISALSGLGEDANILSLINAKANQSDLTALDTEINGTGGIKTKVDFLYDSNNNAYAEIKAQSGTIDILVADWDDNDDANYPYKWELSNGYLVGAKYVSVVFDKDSDTSMLSATVGIDDTNGKVIIYASEIPSATISIQLIAIFNSVNAYELYNQTLINQVAQNTSAISDINNVKLPQYVKAEVMALGETIENEIVNTSSVGGLQFQSRKPSEAKRGTIGIDNSGILLEVADTSVANSGYGELELKKDTLTIRFTDSNNDSHSLTFDANGNLTLDGNAVGGGGGKQLYQHNITMQYSYYIIHLEIINNSATSITSVSTIKDYLLNNNFKYDYNAKQCSGFMNNGSNVGIIYGVHRLTASGNIKADYLKNGTPTTDDIADPTAGYDIVTPL